MNPMSSSSSHFIAAFGAINSYKLLFNKINNKFETNKQENNIKLIELDEVNYQLKIQTKYYDYDTLIKLFDSNIPDSTDLDGVLIILANPDELIQKVTNLMKKNNENNSFKAVIYDQTSELLAKTFEIDDLIQIKLDLNKEIVDDDDEDELDEFINSLFVHTWSDLKLKNDSKATNLQEAEKEEDEYEEDEFEDLISNLAEMKTKASQMGFEERKLYAEEVVKKFWRSINGNEDELNLD
jgi:hypothetical protein